MEIISHRGYWLSDSEKNQKVAFRRSFSMGYGTETDIRDSLGKIVISHDKPRGNELKLTEFLDLVCNESFNRGYNLLLALNIKADGLAQDIFQIMTNYPGVRYFVFDMSVPDMRHYLAYNIPLYTRMSEVEKTPPYLEDVQGVWLDGFEGNWFDIKLIGNLISLGKRVCIVSSELHKRDHNSLWQMLKPFASVAEICLCTDFPEQAAQYFKE